MILAKQGLGSQSLVDELKQIEADLARLAETRGDIVPPDIDLPEGLPSLYREMVSDLSTTLSEELIAGRAADELHELVDRIVVDLDEDANAHSLAIEGNFLEMLRKSAPVELDALSLVSFAEVGCGRGNWTSSYQKHNLSCLKFAAGLSSSIGGGSAVR